MTDADLSGLTRHVENCRRACKNAFKRFDRIALHLERKGKLYELSPLRVTRAYHRILRAEWRLRYAERRLEERIAQS